ncbi:MAG: hypothetical protein AAFN74_22965 [Myxococcota bacterium]
MTSTLLPGLEIEPVRLTPATTDRRADVACFIGFVDVASAWSRVLPPSRRPEIFADVGRWLRDQGWIDAPGSGTDPAVDARQAQAYELLHVPIPCHSFGEFEALFDADGRQGPDPAESTPPYLAAAVQAFFFQGGRRCFVIRAGDALPWRLDAATANAALQALIPPRATPERDPQDRERWQGIGHLHGLDEAVMLVLPDLPHLVAQSLEPTVVPPVPVVPNAAFGPCQQDSLIEDEPLPPPLVAPRCIDEVGYQNWAQQIHNVADFLAEHRRDVQLLATIPLAADDAAAQVDLWGTLLRAGILAAREGSTLGISSAFVQLTHPWLRSAWSNRLPERWAPSDAAVAGALARHTLLNGAFNSAIRTPMEGVFDLNPRVSAAERTRKRPMTSPTELDTRALAQRVTLIGRASAGRPVELLSDVTTSIDERYRPAGANRLMSIWVRALLRAGREFVFEPSNEQTWARIRQRVRDIGLSLVGQGALAGRRPSDGFQVRCDRSTTTQADIDRGRIRAEVVYQPNLPVESIRIQLDLAGGGTRVDGGAA